MSIPNLMSSQSFTNRSRKSFGEDGMDVGFDPQFSYFHDHEKRKIDLKWTNLSLKIKDKEILKGITGHVGGSSCVALMGPSGAGKSSLLNVLAGRVLPSKTRKIEGEIKLNGNVVKPKMYRRQVAYVLQNDLMFPSATCKESIAFSAKLRLPVSVTSDKDKLDEIVEDLLSSLGLTGVKNSLVGSASLRGVSGGERKRVAIGVEIVTNPRLLFLDEPTSGLDSFNAWKVVKILQNLARATGAAVICTIHQPSSEVFNEFENVMMLRAGEVIYNGTVSLMPEIMSKLGRPIPFLTNPADYIMLLAQTLETEHMFAFNADTGYSKPKVDLTTLETKPVEEEIPKMKTDGSVLSEGTSEELAGFWTQAKLLSIREFKHLKRDPTFLYITILARTVFNVVIGAVFFESAKRGPDFQAAVGLSALIFMLLGVFMSFLQPQLINFPLDRGIMIREYQTGTYGSPVYLISKLIVEIPQAFVGSMITVTTLYLMLGMEGNILYFYLLGALVGLCAASLGQMVGAAVKDAKSGQEFGPLMIFPQMLFSGLFIPIGQIPLALRWLQYVSIVKYAVNLGAIIEFEDCGSRSDLDNLLVDVFNCTGEFADEDSALDCEALEEEVSFKSNCLDVLDNQAIDVDDAFFNFIILCVLAASMRLGSLVFLISRANFYAD